MKDLRKDMEIILKVREKEFYFVKIEKVIFLIEK